MNIPISLTLVRLSIIPVFVVVYFLPFQLAHIVAAIIFIVAAITDWLDGYLARSLSQLTDFGAFLDPVADKLLVACALVLITGQHYVPFLSIPAAIIVMRELAISALREWMAELGKRTSMAVTYAGKIKTALQMVALVLLIWYSPHGSKIILWFGVILLYLAAIMTLWSMIIHLKIAWPDLTLSKEK